MSQLIHMRQRIKAISTIKKITSAMRLISRSFHTRMFREHTRYKEYENALSQIFQTVLTHAPEESQSILTEKAAPSHKKLLIIIGSQKGLCGSFNAPIFYWLETHKQQLLSSSYTIVTMGKRVTEYAKKIGLHNVQTLPELKLSTISTLTDMIVALMQDKKTRYASFDILSCSPKSLFSQECKESAILPFSLPAFTATTKPSFDYVWSHNPEQLIRTLKKLHIASKIRYLLFASLLAEHNARFTAMDNATRNAENFLDTMKIQFNKMRQAKITKELAELAGAFEIQGII